MNSFLHLVALISVTILSCGSGVSGSPALRNATMSVSGNRDGECSNNGGLINIPISLLSTCCPGDDNCCQSQVNLPIFDCSTADTLNDVDFKNLVAALGVNLADLVCGSGDQSDSCSASSGGKGECVPILILSPKAEENEVTAECCSYNEDGSLDCSNGDRACHQISGDYGDNYAVCCVNACYVYAKSVPQV